MRVSVDDTKIPHGSIKTVLLNRVDETLCIMADEEKGEVLRYVRDNLGNFTGRAETVQGEVYILLNPGFYWGRDGHIYKGEKA